MRIPIVFFSFLVIASCISFLEASDVGKTFPSEKKSWIDPATKQTLTVLTDSTFNDRKPYQTHETWTSDGKWIVFASNRSGRGSQMFLVNEESGQIVQLTDDVVDSGSMNLSRKEMKMYYMRGNEKNLPRQIVELNLQSLLDDMRNKKVRSPENYTRSVAKLPDSGGFTGFALDSAEDKLYYGIILDQPAKEGEKRAPINPDSIDGWSSRLDFVDIKTGNISKVMDVPFRVGHVQADPWKAGEFFYCHETAGDAPQRMWAVRFDSSENRPIYQETPDEWVTHEVVCGPDEMMFIISGHSTKLRTKPSGIAVVNLRSQHVKLLGQTEENRGGFWHCNGNPASPWAVGDTHSGSLYLVHRTTGEQILLTKGHPMKPDHTHPIFSPDGKRVLIQTGILKEGKSLDLMTVETE